MSNSILPISQQEKQQEVYREEAADFSNALFIDYLNDPEDYYTNCNNIVASTNANASHDYMTTNFEASLTEKEDFVGNEMDFDYNWSTNAAQTSSGEYNFGGEEEEDEEVAGSDTRKLDFQFVDTVGTWICKTLKTVPWTCKSVSAVKYSHYSAILMADHMMNKYLSCTFLLI